VRRKGMAQRMRRSWFCQFGGDYRSFDRPLNGLWIDMMAPNDA